MKNFNFTFISVVTLAIAICSIALNSAVAQESGFSLHDSAGLPKEVILDASIRQRYENADWFRPPAGPTGSKDESYGYGDTKAQLGIGYQQDIFKAYLQGQYSGAYGLPSDGTGIGSSYYTQNESHSSSHDVFIRQGYLKLAPTIEDLKTSGTIGRFLYSSGLESPVENKSLLWVQQKRIAERLIGPFDFTFGRSFDGGSFNAGSSENGTFSASVFRPTDGGFVTDGFDEIQDINVVAAAYSFNTAISEKPGQAQLFYYYYGDSRGNILKTDNQPADVNALNVDNVNINTFGFHWIQLHDFCDQTVDTVMWSALQGGKWGDQDHFAGAAALETGIKFDTVPWTPWLRTGWNYGSGDNNPNDGDHNTFFQMLPTARVYAQTPFYNMMNNQDIFVQAIAQPLENLSIRSDAHALFLTSDNDLLYSGAGATESSVFGYSGSPSNGHSYVGTLLDLTAGYAVNKNLTLSGYYGHLFGGSVPDSNYVDKDIDYFFLEALVKI
jgi:hypothetical protein